jgi:hypothetical protein
LETLVASPSRTATTADSFNAAVNPTRKASNENTDRISPCRMPLIKAKNTSRAKIASISMSDFPYGEG